MEISDIQDEKGKIEITFCDESTHEDCTQIIISTHDLEQLHDYYVYLEEQKQKKNY